MSKPVSYRFSFGPWNISEGGDPFGPDVRAAFAHDRKFALYKKLGFDGVQFGQSRDRPSVLAGSAWHRRCGAGGWQRGSVYVWLDEGLGSVARGEPRHVPAVFQGPRGDGVRRRRSDVGAGADGARGGARRDGVGGDRRIRHGRRCASHYAAVGGGRGAGDGGHRHRLAWHRRRRRQPCDQLRCPRESRGLRPPYRPHRPRSGRG